MDLAQDSTRVDVVIFDCDRHHWMGGGVTGDSLMKVLANFTPSHYVTMNQITVHDGGQTLRWNGWVVRIHGNDEDTAATADEQIYRKLTLVGTHDPDWAGVPSATQEPGTRSGALSLHSILQNKQREEYRGGASLGQTSALRDQLINSLSDCALAA